MVNVVKSKAKKIEIPKRIDLSKLIEKEIIKSEKKQEPAKDEEETTKISEFSFNTNETFRRGRLSATLDEDNKKQTLEETTRDAPKKEAEEVKDAPKKVYEGLYSQNNQLYKNQRRDQPEIRVNQRTISATSAMANNTSNIIQPTLRRAEMIREDRFQRENDNNPNHLYETTRRRDSTDVNPFSPEMEIKEKKYNI